MRFRRSKSSSIAKGAFFEASSLQRSLSGILLVAHYYCQHFLLRQLVLGMKLAMEKIFTNVASWSKSLSLVLLFTGFMGEQRYSCRR
jgi:succinate dehydrogenase/fumarate reductase cytochrome b subunit